MEKQELSPELEQIYLFSKINRLILINTLNLFFLYGEQAIQIF